MNKWQQVLHHHLLRSQILQMYTSFQVFLVSVIFSRSFFCVISHSTLEIQKRKANKCGNKDRQQQILHYEQKNTNFFSVSLLKILSHFCSRKDLKKPFLTVKEVHDAKTFLKSWVVTRADKNNNEFILQCQIFRKNALEKTFLEAKHFSKHKYVNEHTHAKKRKTLLKKMKCWFQKNGRFSHLGSISQV